MISVEKFLTDDKMIRGVAIISTAIVKEICHYQNPSLPVKVALGRVTTGALLLASLLKSRERLGVHFDGDGSFGGLFAEASFEGETRAHCTNSKAEFNMGEEGFSLKPGIGKGHLHVAHSLSNQKEPHYSTVEIATGEIGQDLAFYLQQSKQIPSIVALGTSLDQHGQIDVSCGVIIELRPEVGERVFCS